MRVQPGTKLGRYEIIAHVGSGGMGEVYRARDTHLDRDVALKTIAAAYARDPASRPRFELERRLTAALEHPHICRLLDAGEQDGISYLAMEFLEGESLAERLARGPLPVSVAVGYGIEIADALHHAHRHGVVHRDLKPANVFITRSGAKVLDFGLAKLRPASSVTPPLREDTVPLDVTQAGAVVGSAPYMAPERLEGYDADHRTDVFGFGVLLYEMLTGRRAFEGSNPATLIAAILSHEPAPLGLQDPNAAELEWVLRKCLAKKPDERWQSMADVQIVLKRIAATGFSKPAPVVRRRGSVLAAAVLIPLGLVGAVGWMTLQRMTPVAADPIAMPVNPPPGGAFTPTGSSLQTSQLALSPDGRALAFVAAGPDGVSRIWIQRFSSVAPVAITATEGGTFPFWSPDGRSLGFFTDDELRRVDLETGLTSTLADARNGRGGTWNSAGDILFSPNTTGPILRVSAGGGPATDVTRIDVSRSETSHRWPYFLPDGRRFLYFARYTKNAETLDGIYCGSTDGSSPKLLATSDAGGVFVPPDRVLFLSDGTLVSRTIDAVNCQLSGSLVAVAERVGSSSTFYGAFSASAGGGIAYATSAMTSDLVWVDRTGRRADVLAVGKQHVDFRLSPAGDFLAVAELGQETGGSDIYLRGLVRGELRRVTSTRGTDASPVWSPHGKQIVFRSNRESVHDLYIGDPSSGDTERPLYRSTVAKYPTSWSQDGRIAFHTSNRETKWDVYLADSRSEDAIGFLTTQFNEIQGQFSPDGKAFAYVSDSAGDFQVIACVLPCKFSTPVSTKGGMDPRWSRDGKELFYISADGQLTAVPIQVRGDQVVLGAAKQLFPIQDVVLTPPYTSIYDVSPDGRFLIRVTRGDVRTTPLTVLLNWPLRARD